jgi:hypothetical protein
MAHQRCQPVDEKGDGLIQQGLRKGRSRYRVIAAHFTCALAARPSAGRNENGLHRAGRFH